MSYLKIILWFVGFYVLLLNSLYFMCLKRIKLEKYQFKEEIITTNYLFYLSIILPLFYPIFALFYLSNVKDKFSCWKLLIKVWWENLEFYINMILKSLKATDGNYNIKLLSELVVKLTKEYYDKQKELENIKIEDKKNKITKEKNKKISKNKTGDVFYDMSNNNLSYQELSDYLNKMLKSENEVRNLLKNNQKQLNNISFFEFEISIENLTINHIINRVKKIEKKFSKKINKEFEFLMMFNYFLHSNKEQFGDLSLIFIHNLPLDKKMHTELVDEFKRVAQEKNTTFQEESYNLNEIKIKSKIKSKMSEMENLDEETAKRIDLKEFEEMMETAKDKNNHFDNVLDNLLLNTFNYRNFCHSKKINPLISFNGLYYKNFD